jgi:dynein heavy chain
MATVVGPARRLSDPIRTMSNLTDVDSPERVTPGPARRQSELITTMSSTGSGLSPLRAASPIIEDDSLNGSQDEADAFDGDSSQQQSAAEASLAWFRDRVQSMLRLRSDRVDDLVIKNVDSKRIFLDFIHEPARRRLLVWPGEDDELHAGYDMPCEGRKKAIYFIKQRSFRVEEDGNLSGLMMGDIPCDVLEHLSTVSHEVLYPVLMAGRAKDPDSINKEISDVFHKFLSQVYLTVGQAQGKTLLPLPPRDPNQREGMDARMVKTDKERVHVLESCVVTWTQQIKKVLRQEPPTFIYPGDIETGTKSEFAYWSSRAMDLTSIHEQLSSTKVQKVLQVSLLRSWLAFGTSARHAGRALETRAAACPLWHVA